MYARLLKRVALEITTHSTAPKKLSICRLCFVGVDVSRMTYDAFSPVCSVGVGANGMWHAALLIGDVPENQRIRL